MWRRLANNFQRMIEHAEKEGVLISGKSVVIEPTSEFGCRRAEANEQAATLVSINGPSRHENNSSKNL